MEWGKDQCYGNAAAAAVTLHYRRSPQNEHKKAGHDKQTHACFFRAVCVSRFWGRCERAHTTWHAEVWASLYGWTNVDMKSKQKRRAIFVA